MITKYYREMAYIMYNIIFIYIYNLLLKIFKNNIKL